MKMNNNNSIFHTDLRKLVQLSKNKFDHLTQNIYCNLLKETDLTLNKYIEVESEFSSITCPFIRHQHNLDFFKHYVEPLFENKKDQNIRFFINQRIQTLRVRQVEKQMYLVDKETNPIKKIIDHTLYRDKENLSLKENELLIRQIIGRYEKSFEFNLNNEINKLAVSSDTIYFLQLELYNQGINIGGIQSITTEKLEKDVINVYTKLLKLYKQNMLDQNEAKKIEEQKKEQLKKEEIEESKKILQNETKNGQKILRNETLINGKFLDEKTQIGGDLLDEKTHDGVVIIDKNTKANIEIFEAKTHELNNIIYEIQKSVKENEQNTLLKQNIKLERIIPLKEAEFTQLAKEFFQLDLIYENSDANHFDENVAKNFLTIFQTNNPISELNLEDFLTQFNSIIKNLITINLILFFIELIVNNNFLKESNNSFYNRFLEIAPIGLKADTIKKYVADYTLISNRIQKSVSSDKLTYLKNKAKTTLQLTNKDKLIKNFLRKIKEINPCF